MIGDGFCNDETNNADCSYDGGDCCGSCVMTDHCSQCECIGGANVTNVLIANGFCNDETNSADCNYDGGDCCVNINTDECSNCTCYHQENCLLGFTSDCDDTSGGVITSPGFPENYDNNLDLNWLIEVLPRQRIEIRFLSFDVDYQSSCR